MSTGESQSNGASERVDQLLALFEQDHDLLAYCSRHQDRMLEVKAKLKPHVDAVTAQDIQDALKKYVERHKPREGSSGAADDDLEKLRAGLQQGLLDVVKQIERGYRITMWMYTAAFVVGLLMLIASTVTAMLRETNSAVLIGGLGAADVIAFLIFKPAQDLQASRGSLAQLQAAFFAWINDIHNWNDYLYLLQNESGSALPSFEKWKQISEIQGRSTEQMVRLISMHTQYAPDMKKPSRRGAGRNAPPASEPAG